MIIYSPRRFGKTSLILETIHRLKKEGFPCIYIDVSTITSKRDFAQRLASTIAKETSKGISEAVRKIKENIPKITPKIVLKGEGDMEFFVEFEDKKSDMDKLLLNLYDLPQRIAEKKKKKLIVAFDEFQEIQRLDGEDIEKNLRAKIQHHSDVAYVFMGSKRHLMERIFNDKTRAFYKIGKHLSLRMIPKEEFSAFIIKRLKETGIRIELPLVDEILKITACHPYYTQMLMHEIWNESYPERVITAESVKRGMEQVFLNQESLFVNLWDSVSSKQRNLLVALSADEELSLCAQSTIIKYELGSAATVNKSLKALENKELVEQKGERYRIQDIFFKEWVKARGS
ncbi:MAG: ATP-binding protein [bacterium]